MASIITATPMRKVGMSTERSLYKLMTWLSPAFPVGAFSYSHGLEWAVEDGLVRDEATLRNWIEAGLAHEFGAIGAAQLRGAYEAVTAHDAPALREAVAEAHAWQPDTGIRIGVAGARQGVPRHAARCVAAVARPHLGVADAGCGRHCPIPARSASLPRSMPCR